MSHTPGPWIINKEQNKSKLLIVSPWSENVTPENTATWGDFRGAHIANITWNDGMVTLQQALANAKLIAAAPELLESLQWLVAEVGKLQGEISLIGMGKCLEAIDKATK